MLSIVAVNVNLINNTNYRITSITNYQNSNSQLLIEYTPPHNFSNLDTIQISNSNCTPKIDGFYNIAKIISPGKILIKHESITNIGTFGDMKVQTSYSNQFSQVITDVVEPVVQTAASITGNVASNIISTAASGIGTFLKSIFGDLWWIVPVFIGIIILSSSSLSALYLKKQFL